MAAAIRTESEICTFISEPACICASGIERRNASIRAGSEALIAAAPLSQAALAAESTVSNTESVGVISTSA